MKYTPIGKLHLYLKPGVQIKKTDIKSSYSLRTAHYEDLVKLFTKKRFKKKKKQNNLYWGH